MAQQRRIVLFYSYEPSDDILRDKLARFLRPLVRETLVEEWSDQQMQPGVNVAQERKRALESATHILLLLSAEYLASEECYQEMLDALERQKHDKARVIPILLRPCLLPKILEESLSCLPRNGQPVSVWPKRDKAFFDVARDICQILRLPLTPLRRRSTNRDRLLDRVFAYWIEGLLEPTLKEEGIHLDLVLQAQSDMVINPWSSQVQEIRQVSRSLPTARSIDRTYDHAHGELLILGEPGAGKTILLLELARILLERTERDEQTRMPVVFNLSSWPEKRQSLRDWLVEELWTKYQIPRNIGQDWIDAGQMTPLLDGLDEVRKEEARAACVEAINEYYQWQSERGSSPLVVCCRSKEYIDLPTRLMLQEAVSIMPLTSEQINSYLEPFGEQVTVLKQALDEDAELRRLACQPLMLKIFTLVYQGAHPSEVPIGETLEKMRHIIFIRYVEHMLRRRASLKRRKQKQVIRWLAFLAKQMQREGQTLFSVENLQPNWLSVDMAVLHMIELNLLGGMLVGLIFGLLLMPLIGLGSAWTYGLILGQGLAAGLIFWTDRKIQPAEALGWSWKKVPFGLAYGLASGAFVWVFTGGTLGTSDAPLVFGLPPRMFFGITAGLAITLFNGLEKGVSRKRLVERLSLSPNEGIWRSCKNGLLVGLFVALPVGLVAGLYAGLLPGLLLGLLAGFVGWLAGGLFDFVSHFVLRLILWSDRKLPLMLVAFLDEMANRLLLRKVGGSYMFVHWLLRDHLALQETLTPPNTSLEPSRNSLQPSQ